MRDGVGRRAFDWAFRNRHTGLITIGQWPNAALWLFLLGSVLARVVPPGGQLASVLRIATEACLVWWALDEVVRGVNPWRRALGGAVLLSEFAPLLRSAA